MGRESRHQKPRRGLRQGKRGACQVHRSLTNRAQKNTLEPDPLTAFLKNDDFLGSRLHRVAIEVFKRPLKVTKFRAALLKKLRTVPCSQRGKNAGQENTFYDRLKRYGKLSVFLCPPTLCEIWKRLQLKQVILADRELEGRSRSAERYPVRFHRVIASEIERHQKALDNALKRHKVPELWLFEYFSALNRELIRELRLVFESKYPGSQQDLLGNLRKLDIAVQVKVFEFLKNRFPHLSDRFLRRLTQLVCSLSELTQISDDLDEALRKALERQRQGQKS